MCWKNRDWACGSAASDVSAWSRITASGVGSTLGAAGMNEVLPAAAPAAAAAPAKYMADRAATLGCDEDDDDDDAEDEDDVDDDDLADADDRPGGLPLAATLGAVDVGSAERRSTEFSEARRSFSLLTDRILPSDSSMRPRGGRVTAGHENDLAAGAGLQHTTTANDNALDVGTHLATRLSLTDRRSRISCSRASV